MIINPAEHDYRNIYKLMVGVIVPRPIAFVSTISREGIPNLAPFSFFTGISANPPVICFSPMIRGSDGGRKDTLRNIEAVMECRLIQLVDVSSKPLGGSIVLGEVLRFHIDDALVDNYKIDPDKLHPIGRLGGPTYTRTTDRFDMSRPQTGEIKPEEIKSGPKS